MALEVKICGLSEPATLEAAIAAGADLVGLVSFPKSPRHVAPEQAAALASIARGRARVGLLTVDASDDLLAELVAAAMPDVLQLHGSETPERVAALRRLFGREVWKAVPVGEADDLVAAEPYWAVADRVLFDAKPPAGAELPGGNGVAFDWRLLANLDPKRRFVLSGGLTPENVGEAVRVTHAPAVDVSSGVERAPGVKDPDLIVRFVREARSAGVPPREGPAS
ncbi:phosphoribosylanthranilate isomerase [Hansschlegelia plantiphila]|uniref:N-(5'-phosphoribosyl)anthranilate isomerase n=1 Tax=Hansschlegelia plantiphila TaxID=374655 RepID=A0A9W6J104_9HYPH|nr:phosphoribosylanthranilate isomerase [Hansschlegelia plantiphila]GLK67280.1 N-(5'-phosphoribosyl)anthranilate isomerase [Hansschlegelia plantiphila]